MKTQNDVHDSLFSIFKQRIQKLSESQESISKPLHQQARDMGRHVAEGIKAVGEGVWSRRHDKSGKREAFQESVKREFNPVKHEAKARSKRALGMESNMHLHALSQAMDQFHEDYVAENYSAAIIELNRIEKDYGLADGGVYDAKLKENFSKMRDEVVAKLSGKKDLDAEAKEILLGWRKRAFEAGRAGLLGILQSGKAGGEDSREFWEKWLDKADLSKEHTKERIKKLRRHVNYDSRDAMDYLMRELVGIEYRDDGKHYLELATILASIGRKIADGTVNRSILEGLNKAAEELIRQAQAQDERRDIAGLLPKIEELRGLQKHIGERIKKIEQEFSYSSTIEKVHQSLKESDREKLNEAMNQLFRKSQEKDYLKKTLVTPYVPPQMEKEEKQAICAQVMQKKLKELYGAAFQVDIGLSVGETKGDAAKLVGGMAESGTKSVTEKVKDIGSGLASSLVTAVLPKDFFLTETLSGLAGDLSGSALEALGNKYLTDPLVEKVEGTLDQKQGKEKKAVLMKFLLTLTEGEQAELAKAFAEKLAITFPLALEKLMINRHDTAAMEKIAGKLMETSLYRLSKFADELAALRKKGGALDMDEVANYMIRSMVEANEHRVLVKGIKQSWRVPVLEEDPDHPGLQMRGGHPHLEDMFGGRCGIVTVDASGTLNYYAPDNSDPGKHGYRFCREEDLPIGYDAYKFNRETGRWGSGVMSDVPNPTLLDKQYGNHKGPYQELAKKAARGTVRNQSTHSLLRRTMDKTPGPMQQSYHAFHQRIEKLENAQKNLNKPLHQQARDMGRHVAEGIKAVGEGVWSRRHDKSGKREAFQESVKREFNPVKHEAKARSKRALGMESNMHLHALSQALDQFHEDYVAENYSAAIIELNRIEKDYGLADGGVYDAKLKENFSKMRDEVVAKLSGKKDLDAEAKEILLGWRKRAFEAGRAGLLGILQSGKAGGEDSRESWEKWLDKADLSKEHTKERIKKLRRHVNYDSRDAMDYLMRELVGIEYRDDGKHYLELATILASIGRKIADGTVNRSILEGLNKAAEELIRQAQAQDERRDIAGLLPKIEELRGLQKHIGERIKKIEQEFSYSSTIEKVHQSLKESDREKLNEAM